jgi:hypothetical protein
MGPQWVMLPHYEGWRLLECDFRRATMHPPDSVAARQKFCIFHPEPSQNQCWLWTTYLKKTTIGPFNFLYMGPVSDVTQTSSWVPILLVIGTLPPCLGLNRGHLEACHRIQNMMLLNHPMPPYGSNEWWCSVKLALHSPPQI